MKHIQSRAKDMIKGPQYLIRKEAGRAGTVQPGEKNLDQRL